MLRRNAIATLAAAFVPAQAETPKSLAGAPATIKVRLKLAAGQATIDLPLESYVAAVLAGAGFRPQTRTPTCLCCGPLRSSIASRRIQSAASQ